MKALDLAKYVINYALDQKKPISNLQLQKILYFVNGEYYRKTGRFLIEDSFFAYPYGPVNEVVYNKYRGYGSLKITDREDEVCILEGLDIINSELDIRIRMSAFELVNESHEEGKAWKITVDKKGYFQLIEKGLMIKEFINV